MNDIERKAKIWNNRLSDLIYDKKFGYNSQDDFAKAFNKRFKEAKCSQRDVSRWLRVGEKENKGNNQKAIIGFPKYSTMTLIANFFEKDVGYLTGETNAEKFNDQTAGEYLGLDSDIIKKIREITNPGDLYINGEKISHNPPLSQRQDVLYKIFSNENFFYFFCSLCTLEKLYNTPKKSDIDDVKWNELVEKYGEKTVSQAQDLYSTLEAIDSDQHIDIPDDVRDAYFEIDDAVYDGYVMQRDLKEKIDISRYKLFESFEALILDLYPLQD